MNEVILYHWKSHGWFSIRNKFEVFYLGTNEAHAKLISKRLPPTLDNNKIQECINKSVVITANISNNKANHLYPVVLPRLLEELPEDLMKYLPHAKTVRYGHFLLWRDGKQAKMSPNPNGTVTIEFQDQQPMQTQTEIKKTGNYQSAFTA